MRDIVYPEGVDGTVSQAQRPLRRDAERNRQRILAAARVLVADQGLGISHDQIAEAAEVAVGTVYRRFPDKTSLIEALFTEKLDDVIGAARNASKIQDPWSALVAFMTDILEIHAANRGLKELAMGACRDLPIVCRSQEMIAPIVGELVDRCHQAKALREGVGVADLALVPMMVGAVMDSARTVAPELWRRTLMIILDGLRAGHIGSLSGETPTSDQLDQILVNWLPPAR
jgi:AcrR family transcriptional regulator